MTEAETNAPDRVRGIVQTPDGRLALIKRVRSGTPEYWVFPGGGVEPTDADHVAALRREILEELGSNATIGKLVFVIEKDDQRKNRELFFLVTVNEYGVHRRTGPEFLDTTSGEYIIDRFLPSRAEITSRNIKPDIVKAWLIENIERLEDVPDLTRMALREELTEP